MRTNGVAGEALVILDVALLRLLRRRRLAHDLITTEVQRLTDALEEEVRRSARLREARDSYASAVREQEEELEALRAERSEELTRLRAQTNGNGHDGAVTRSQGIARSNANGHGGGDEDEREADRAYLRAVAEAHCSPAASPDSHADGGHGDGSSTPRATCQQGRPSANRPARAGARLS